MSRWEDVYIWCLTRRFDQVAEWGCSLEARLKHCYYASQPDAKTHGMVHAALAVVLHAGPADTS